ncbi:hypothetical protein [Leifsonia virtsii]|uniref:Uncharacterized protein n=1 Tax=Leifsonia virtsii TaxID=3035915 RepID=A0ABT8J3F9_9MICO|nr:hypothetical protein [Leifsonia virtsii]MDN4599443.1 hypothetical protein [Leifsonia virtsii]
MTLLSINRRQHQEHSCPPLGDERLGHFDDAVCASCLRQAAENGLIPDCFATKFDETLASTSMYWRDAA